MKTKILFLALFSVLCADDGEILAKARDFEAKGDYKNAMIYYKKLALANTGAQNSSGISKPNLASNSGKNSAQYSKKQNLKQNLANLDLNSTPKPSKNQNFSEFLGIKYYEPIYAVFTHDHHKKQGRSPNEAHFAFSFERPISYDYFGFGEKISFAYTQNSWWQITADSAPFRENNYKPELFMSLAPDFADELKLGVLHESNGKDGTDSRSINHLYAQSSWRFGGFEITPRLWYAFGLDQRNKDISEYMGYGDLRASYSFGRHKVMAKWRNNLRLNSQNRGAIELDFIFPLFNSGLYGYFRYFSGYAESLADYKKSVDKIGLGVSFVEF